MPDLNPTNPTPGQPAAAEPTVIPMPGQQPSPEFIYTIPVPITAELMNQLVPLSGNTGLSIAIVCRDLIKQAVNVQMLSQGTINDLSEEAQDIIKAVSVEALLDALRIYNVAKTPATPGQEPAPGEPAAPAISETSIVFTTTSDVIDFVKKMNATRKLKGLAPLEKSFCELLYHYCENLGDHQVFQKVTGITLTEGKATVKTWALNEREVNGCQTNLIESASIFSQFAIVDTPETVIPAPTPTLAA
jgi:hypothetical protein